MNTGDLNDTGAHPDADTCTSAKTPDATSVPPTAETPHTLARAALLRMRLNETGKRTKKPAALRQKKPEPAAQAVLSPTQQQGLAIEDLACQYLCNQGLVILARNLETHFGEIDILAREDNDLVFCEVRHRLSNRFGAAEATVTVPKQRRLVRTAHALLPSLSLRFFNGRTPACRFDILGHDGATFTWLRAAFDADTREHPF